MPIEKNPTVVRFTLEEAWKKIGQWDLSSYQRWLLATAIILLALGAGTALGALASAHQAIYITGCLNEKKGTLYNVAIGTKPEDDCKADDPEVQWSDGDITGISAGLGLTGGGASGEVTLDADTAFLQRRVSDACPTGSLIRAINVDGTIICELDQNSGGDITSITAGSGMSGGGTSGDVTLSLANGGVMTTHIADDAVIGPKVANITRTITANLMGWNSEFTLATGVGFGVRMLSSGNTSVIYSFAVPQDYAGGDLVIKEWYRLHDTLGVAKIFRHIGKVTESGQTVSVQGDTPFDLIGTTGFPYRTWTLSGASVLPGELVRIQLERRGDLAGDTMGRLDILAVAVDYPAEQ
jgi:hypothetical protein